MVTSGRAGRAAGRREQSCGPLCEANSSAETRTAEPEKEASANTQPLY